MRTAFIKTLCKIAATRKDLYLLTGDLGFSVLEEFYEQFPDQYVNVGVAEQNLTGIAGGMARCGKTCFTYSIANFPTLRCLEQIRNDVCYHDGDVKVVAVGGGFTYGSQGYTHHGIEDLGILRALPNMVVVAPADPMEAELATYAIAEHKGPCYLRLGKAGEPVVHTTRPDFKLGKAIQLRDGDDLTLIATGSMLKPTVELANRLAAAGHHARVLSMHTIKPIDTAAILAAAADTGAIMTLEEHNVLTGLGAAVADVLAQSDGPRAVFAKYGVPDQMYARVGSQQYMRDMCGDAYAAALAVVERKTTLVRKGGGTGS